MNLLPTSYFPSIFYLQQTQNFTATCISVNELYGKQSFRNRCEILTGNGIHALSVPVTKPNGSKTLTKDIKIIQSDNWKIDHWRAIKSAYQNAPYFEYYDLEIHNLIFADNHFLIDLNEKILHFITNHLDLATIPINSEFIPEREEINYLVRKPNFKKYIQVFSDRFNFQSNLSYLDILFCEGPLARNWILEQIK